MPVRFVGVARRLALLAAVALVAVTVGRAEPISAQGDTLSVVYLDGSRPPGTSVWIAAADGSSKRVVGELLGPGLRLLDFRAGLLAVADGDLLVTINLASNVTKRLTVGERIQSAYVASNTTVYYSTHPGCGPVENTTMLGRFNVASETSEKVVDVGEWPGAEVLRYNADADELTVTSRACDPGVSNIWIMNAKTGDTKQTIPVDGCGWAAVAPTGTQMLLSFDLCKVAGDDAFPDLRSYTLPDGAAKEIRFTKDAPSRQPFVYAPDGKRAAYGLVLDRDSETAKPKSGGIWTLDTASLEKTKLWQDQGQEVWAIGWSPDSSKLLVASLEGENTCTFSVLEVSTAKATTIPGLTACNEKGTLVGFFAQP